MKIFFTAVLIILFAVGARAHSSHHFDDIIGMIPEGNSVWPDGDDSFEGRHASYGQDDYSINFSNGDSYYKIGDTVYGSDGSSYTRIGDTVYGPNGSTYTQIGDTVFGPDGTTCTHLGNDIYCN